MERILEINRGPEGEIIIRLCSPRAFPGEVSHHLIGAGRESILAVRSLLDAALRRLEEVEKKGEGKPGPTRIDVQ